MFKSKKEVLVVGGELSYHKPYNFLFEPTRDHRELYKKPEKFGLVLFTGGSDVDPGLYGDDWSNDISQVDKTRDVFEKNVFNFAVENKIPMAGICRGLQFLNVMAGGKLLHDIMGHTETTSYHTMETYKGTYRVNSLHHQACIPTAKSYVIGWTPQNDHIRVYGNYDRNLRYWSGPIVEAMIFPDIYAYGVQYHPEMMNNTELAVQWFVELATDFKELDNMSNIVKKWTHRKMFHEQANKTASASNAI